MTGTPHIEAAKGDFAETVLMPGDPLRAKALAENHLDDVRLVNSVRNMFGYTGTFKGRPVSIMGSGMGMPSISIYAHELFDYYGVEQIIRVGTCGGLSANMQVGDLEGDMDSDCLMIDRNKDGHYGSGHDLIIDWNDENKDGKPDLQVVADNSGLDDRGRFSAHYMWIIDTDHDQILNYIDWHTFEIEGWDHGVRRILDKRK